VATVLLPAWARAGASRAAGTLQLNGVFAGHFMLGDCPAGAPAEVGCWPIDGVGVVPGLGRTTVRFTLFDEEHLSESCSVASTPDATFTIPGKGDLYLVGKEAACHSAGVASMSFTVTGGSGAFAAATGAGVLRAEIGRPDPTHPEGPARLAWTGTLTVPGLDFDTTPPVLSGASTKTVRIRQAAKARRVTYTVTAHDEVDGGVAVACTPRSGSSFRIGRTRVTCSATDTSGNTTTARFWVVVRRA
jgi:hypothetical protein